MNNNVINIRVINVFEVPIKQFVPRATSFGGNEASLYFKHMKSTCILR